MARAAAWQVAGNCQARLQPAVPLRWRRSGQDPH
ncbi:hypothetical protein ACPA9J_24600 [Pseudomonas aeruginosa]